MIKLFKLTMIMKNLKFLLTILSVFVCAFHIQAEKGLTIHVDEAGSLNALLNKNRADVINHEAITSLTLTGQIYSTDFDAIKRMENLKTLDLSNVEILWDGAIPNDAFEFNDSLKNVLLPISLKKIGDRAFKNKVLSSLDFSVCQDLEELGVDVFDHTVMENDTLDFSTNNKLKSFGHMVISDTDQHIGTFSYFEGNVILPRNLEVIPEATFSWFKGSIDIPDSVKEIGNFAFCSATLNEDPKLPKFLEKIDYKAFAWISVSSFDFSICPDLQELGPEVFFNTKVKSGILDFSTNSKLTKFGSLIWNDYHLGTFSNFQGDVILPYNLEVIPEATFSSFDGSVEIPSSIEKIAPFAFCHARLKKEFILPSTLATIEEKAFFNSTIKEIDLPEYLTFIGDSAFANCDKLTEIISRNTTPPSLGLSVFSGVNIKDCHLHVPGRNISVYATADQWKDFIDITSTNEISTLIQTRSIENNIAASFYPNPTTDVLNINGNDVENIEIYSTNGKLVKSEKNSNTVNTQDLPSGIYLIKIKTTTGIVTDKLIKK